jgi:hypothetical protein
MFLRSCFIAAIALLLGGCNGWWSEIRLIPVAARDGAGLQGTYAAGEDRMTLVSSAQGLVRAIDPAGEETPSEVALALLQEAAPRPSLTEEAAPEADAPPSVALPDRDYLMEIAVGGDEGKTAYLYAIARVSYADDGTADRIDVLSPLCSRATETFAARKEQKACIFDNYDRLRAAAFDALAWYDDARMVVDATTWQRENEAQP